MNETDEQLNLWARGALPEAERLALEQKMAEDPVLAREAEFAKALRQTMQSEPVTPPGEFGLARLQKAIRAEQEESREVSLDKDVPPHKEASPDKDVPPRQNVWKLVAMAACVTVVVQAGLLLGPERRAGDTAVDISPASGNVKVTGPSLQIVFDPSATVTDIQRAVRAVNGNLVSGPSALGVFSLQLPEDASSEAAVAGLREFDFVDEVIAP